MRLASSIIFIFLFQCVSHAAEEPQGIPWKCHIIDNSSRGADGVKLSDINGDGLLDITTGWEEGGLTRVYVNPGPKRSNLKWPAVTVGKTPSVEDAVFVDLDGDGAQDVISSCEGKTKKIFIHWNPKEKEKLLKGDAWKQYVLPASVKLDQQWMYAWPMQIDGKHGVDIVAGTKGHKNALLGWFEASQNPRDLAAYQWYTISPVGWIMSIWKKDMDGDQDLDLVISDRRGKQRGCRWLENPGKGAKLKQTWVSHRMGASNKEVMSMHLDDLDGDGLEDAVVAVKDMKVLFLKRLDQSGKRWKTFPIFAGFQAGNTRAVMITDVNGDEKKDLVVTTWNAKGRHGVFWLEYDKDPYEKKWKAHAISGKKRGIKYDRIEMLDLDGDGDLDLLTCEEMQDGVGMGVFWHENPNKSSL